jgi:Arylsulfatase regulator (Fe-S oxidoreductase)
MTLELKPLGNSCNIGCDYCYQEPMRIAGNVRVSKTYDLDLMMRLADESRQTNNGYSLFGGEALLVPKKDLEKIFKRSYEKYGMSMVQTNASLIDDEHIELFKKYNVSLGISIDGPNELNNARKSLNKNIKTEDVTQKIIDNIVKLRENDIHCGVIICVHKLNGVGDNLKRLLNFITWLGQIGIVDGNIHMLEIDSEKAEYLALSKEENTNAFLRLAEFFEKPENLHFNFEPFREMKRMQSCDNEIVSCIWSSCDPLNTQAVYGIEANGQLSNCGMVNKEGVEFDKSTEQDFLRDIILYQTEPEFNGCKGCPYFVMCNGYCPGSSINSDWRNKTEHCETLKKMFQFYEIKVEEEGKIPFSKYQNRKKIEEKYIEYLYNGKRLSIEQIMKEVN